MNEGGGDKLYRSDGTYDGTHIVKDIDNGPSNPNRLTNENGMLFFAADSADHSNELWKSDGTEEKTVLVKDINPSGGTSPDELINIFISPQMIVRME